MALTLNNKKIITSEFDTVKITSFAVDLEALKIYISYDEMAGEDIIKQTTITLDSDDFQNTILDASNIANTDIYTPLKTSLYNKIQQYNSDLTGNIT